MIKINKDFQAIPSRLIENITLQQTSSAIATQNGNLYTTNYNHDTVKEALSLLYHDKCAYCESKITSGAYLQVEHYRPKAKVDAKDLPNGQVHKGYYWLGNEWSNLLFACQKCNQQGAKGNRFPILGIRVLTHPQDLSHYFILHQSMLDEIPLLLNPELVDPSDHLSIDHVGVLHGKSGSGDISIQIYRLNRVDLIIERKKIIDHFVNRINKQLSRYTDTLLPTRLSPGQFQDQMTIIFEDLIEGQLPQEQYSFVYINILNQFDTLILPHIDPAFQQEVKSAFQTFIQAILP